MACTCLFKEEEQINWLKCWQAFHLVQKGLNGFITSEIQRLHTKAFGHLSINSLCKASTLSHTCDENLRNPYITVSTSLRNTDATKWCSSVWEYTKSFIDSPGYKDKSSIQDIDIIGIFQIIKHCSIFQNNFTCFLFDRQREFVQVSIICYSHFDYNLVCLFNRH